MMVQALLKRPYYVIVSVLILMLMGTKAINQLPVQILPDISKNEIKVRNVWPQATPEEMEREIVEPIEELLSKISGVIEYKSDIMQGSANTYVKFATGINMDQAYMDVIDRINKYSGMPKTAQEPVITNLAINNRGSVATLLLSPASKDLKFTREDFSKAFEYYIRRPLQGLDGVSSVGAPLNLTEQRIDIEFDPHRLAIFQLTPEDIVRALQNSVSKSSGSVDQGTRRFTVYFKGRYDLDELNQIVVAKKQQREIRLFELASVNVSFVHDALPVIWDGKKSFYINIYPTNSANTLALIDDIHQLIGKLNSSSLKDFNMTLSASQDDSKSINNAVNMVTGNLLTGIVLATLVLLVFIRRKRALAVIFASLPVSLLTTFLVLEVLGRSLNLISLAGIALSTGMVLDASIVMLDSIIRRKQDGMDTYRAVTEGAAEVGGAITTSVVSSVIIFIPIVTMQSAEGQLFHDLAITISASLISSLLVSLTLIPLLLKSLLDKVDVHETQLPFINTLSVWLAEKSKSKTSRLAGISLLLVMPVALLTSIMPHAEVLPQVNSTTVWGYLSFNQSLNNKAIEEEVMKPLVDKIEQHIASGKEPQVGQYLLYAENSVAATMLITTQDSEDAKEVQVWLKQLLNQQSASYEGYTGISSILRTSLSNNRDVSIDISGRDFNRLREIGAQVEALIAEEFPDIRSHTNIPLELSNPNHIFTPRIDRLQALGESQQGIADKLSMLNYGKYVTEYFDGNKSLQMFLKTQQWEGVEELLDVPFYYSAAGMVPLRTLVNHELNVGEEELFRVNGHRTLSVKVSAPEDMALQAFIEEMDAQVGDKIKALVSDEEFISYRGSASKLEELLSEMGSQFMIASAILFLLVTGLFQSLRYGLVSVLSMPIAIFGGALSLLLVNMITFQPMDIITMLGFIILIGLVINNAILFVDCYRSARKTTQDNTEAIGYAIRYRSRAILMSSITSILGMLPLAVIAGTGTEIYRGLAVVICGGMIFSLIFSVPLMSMLLATELFAEKVAKNQSSTSANENISNTGTTI